MQDKIHVSRATAELLTAAGKGGWLSSREDRPLCGNNVNATYWLTKPIKQPKQKKVDYNFSTDTRYDDVELQVTENSDPSDLASWTLELLGSQLRNMTSAQAAFRGESGDQEKDDTVSFDMKGIVLHQLEALVKRIDATYVEQTTNVYDVCVALSAVDDFLQKGSKEQPCSEGNTCALATIALIFAAFVHDIIDNSARKEKETKGEHYVTFSSFKLWDALMSDDCDKVRLFFFVDAVQQSRFFAVIVFAVSRFQKDPSVVPLIDMKIDSQTDDTENSTDDSINDHLVAMEGAEQVAFVSATVTEAKAIPCEDSMHSSDVVCKDDVENMSEERGKETQDCHEGDGKDQLMAKGFTNTSAEEEHGQLEHDDRSIAYETSTRSVNL